MAHVAGLEVCRGGSFSAHATENHERKRGVGWGYPQGVRRGRTFHEELGEGNETEDVRSEHCVDVLVLDITDAVDAMSAASVVDCHDVTYE
jgi:hypothetical protein